VPRLDAERIGLWRDLCQSLDDVRRRIDAGLVEEFDLPLAWFEVLAALQRSGGSARVSRLCEGLGEVPSSFSRRLDRMEAEGHVEREVPASTGDRRAVVVSLTRSGRVLWRDANVAFRRLLQLHFAGALTGTDLAALQRVVGKLRLD
jgi:DNA-binding MarR family transcriptional regulator